MRKPSFSSLLQETDWVFFDFFDTIALRSISDDAVLEHWAYRLAGKLRFALLPEELYRYRRKALVELYRQKNRKEEFSYREIMKRTYVLCHTFLYPCPFEEFYRLAYETELDVERATQSVNPVVREYIAQALQADKHIGILSDFYFGEGEIRTFLSDLGYSDETFEKVIVSADCGLKKQSGNLYTYAQEQIGEGSRCLMVGDNPVSDVEMAKKKGWQSWQVAKSEKKPSIAIRKGLRGIAGEYRKKPFAGYAFSLYYYIRSIYEYAVKHKIGKLAFLSREGYLLKQLFEIYRQDQPVYVEAEYLCVSRLSTFLPSLQDCRQEKFTAIFSQYGDLSLRAFLRNLQFPERTVGEIAEQLQADADSVVFRFEKSDLFAALKENALFVETYERLRAESESALKGYMRQVLGDGEEVVLVDVGWKGTMQDNLYRLWKGEKRFVGLYYGLLHQTGAECADNRKYGFLFEKYPDYSADYYVWEFETHLIEQLLFAPHGSTSSYCTEDGKYLPVFQDSAEDRAVYERVKPIQEDMTEVFRRLCDLFGDRAESVQAYWTDFTKIHLKTELLLNRSMLAFEKEALTEKTNNFGWFSTIPHKTGGKSSKWRSFLREMGRLHRQGGERTLMRYLGYFAVKMNAREKYGWKRWAYRLVYILEVWRIKKR